MEWVINFALKSWISNHGYLPYCAWPSYFERPSQKDTFYSQPHNSYLSIDFFPMPLSLGSGTSPKESSRSRSMTTTLRGPWNWRLNEIFLQDLQVQAKVLQDLCTFFTTNDSPDCDLMILWEANKVYIRGTLIKRGSQSRKKLRPNNRIHCCQIFIGRKQSINTLSRAPC